MLTVFDNICRLVQLFQCVDGVLFGSHFWAQPRWLVSSSLGVYVGESWRSSVADKKNNVSCGSVTLGADRCTVIFFSHCCVVGVR